MIWLLCLTLNWYFLHNFSDLHFSNYSSQRELWNIMFINMMFTSTCCINPWTAMTPKLLVRNYAFVNKSLIVDSFSLPLSPTLFFTDADCKPTAISSEEEGIGAVNPGRENIFRIWMLVRGQLTRLDLLSLVSLNSVFGRTRSENRVHFRFIYYAISQ